MRVSARAQDDEYTRWGPGFAPRGWGSGAIGEDCEETEGGREEEGGEKGEEEGRRVERDRGWGHCGLRGRRRGNWWRWALGVRGIVARDVIEGVD